MRHNKIKVFYNEKQVLQSDSATNFSKSPLKPKLLIAHLIESNLGHNLDYVSNFRPYNAYDFQIAHELQYITNFFEGKDTSNGLAWTPQFANSVRYTNASLYEAIKNCILKPHEVSFSPTSGFHHAQPHKGSGFCTFSGQVIASVKALRNFAAVGCYIDLDGHFGNSIEDTRTFQPELNEAIPIGFNFNTRESGEMYVKQLKSFVYNKLQPAILSGQIDYVVWCHGADSHEDDSLGRQVSTKQWVECADFFWSWVKQMDETLGRPLSVACSLFGGYRADDYNSVLSLHATDLVKCMNNLLELNVSYETKVSRNPERWQQRYAASTAIELYDRSKSNYSLVPYSQSLRDRKTRLDKIEEYLMRQHRNQDFDSFYDN